MHPAFRLGFEKVARKEPTFTLTESEVMGLLNAGTKKKKTTGQKMKEFGSRLGQSAAMGTGMASLSGILAKEAPKTIMKNIGRGVAIGAAMGTLTGLPAVFNND